MSRAPDQAAEPMRVVVALDPERARFVAALPDATQAQVVLVTSKPWTIGATALAGSVVTNLHARAQRMAGGPLRAHPSTGWRRWYLAMRHPLAIARRRGWLHDVARLASNEGSAAVWRGLALAATRSATAMPNRVVCLDGLDYLAAAPVVATPGVLLEPGGARWLGDRGIGYAPVPSPITPHPSAPAG